MSEKTHWKKLTNPNYLGAYAFQPGEEKVVTIKEVNYEVVQNQNGKEECIVCHFVEDIKPMILNKTNCDTIARVIGTPYIEDWNGQRIILKVRKVSAFGETVDAVRVAKERPVDEVVLCEVCGKAITPAGGRTAKEIAAATKTKFKKMMCMGCARKEANND